MVIKSKQNGLVCSHFDVVFSFEQVYYVRVPMLGIVGVSNFHFNVH